MRRSLQTTVWTTRQLRLNDLSKAHRENGDEVAPPEFNEAVVVIGHVHP